MKLLSEYRDNDRTAKVYATEDGYLAVYDDSTQTHCTSASGAENLCEDYVSRLVVLDEKVILKPVDNN